MRILNASLGFCNYFEIDVSSDDEGGGSIRLRQIRIVRRNRD